MEKQVHVSFYASLFRTECRVLTLEEIIILIRRRRWKNEILAYRTALAEGRAEEAVGTLRTTDEHRQDASPTPVAGMPDAVTVGPAEPVFQEMAA